MRNAPVILSLFLVFSCKDSQERILPAKTRLTESVYASVTVQPDSLYQAYASVGGILDKNLVEEGQLVEKGSALVQIINNAPKLNTDNARLALQLAQENYQGSSAVLGTLEDEIKSATLSLKNDSINYTRQKRLWEQHIGSKVQYEGHKLAFELSRNNLRQLKNKYDQTKNELSTQMQQARNNYATSQITAKDFTVSSKINGKVYALFKNPGEIVSTMEPVASVGSASYFIIEMLIDEVDIVKLSVGQKALITLDAYGTEVFGAKVSKIYPKKDERSQTFKVKATFDFPPKALYPGLSGEGNIIIAEKENALTIPKEFLMEGNKVMTADGAVEVKTGLQNLERVEILSGLSETTEILKPKE
jgi:RND family efflux transporter MFP subunit